MYLSLVVVPDLAARLRENGPYRQQEPHLLRLEDAALRIDERDALAALEDLASKTNPGFNSFAVK